MKKMILRSVFPVLFAGLMIGCEVDQVREGRMPDVDVDVSGDPGQLPAYDVEGPDVDVTMEEDTITVPDVDVDMKEKTITTPDIEITPPGDDG